MGIYIQEYRFFSFPVVVTHECAEQSWKRCAVLKTQKGISKSLQLLQCSLPSVSPGGVEVKEAGLI